ncbi:MAG: peptidylprolyl isomerase [Pseudomonadota bacterium]|nr:peptidylprolyl isomerase [Pseudomonadota bacterium]
MRFIVPAAAAIAALATSCTQAPAVGQQAGWRPQPVTNAIEPADTIKNAPADAWRMIAPENLLLMDLANGARIAIELAPDFAPQHVANIRAFARAGWWTGASVYRVQDNYVVQWGIGDAERPMPAGVVALPPAEYDRALAGLAIRPLGYPDAFAPMVGHVDGWPVGYDPASGRAWLTHCYGTVGVARDLAPDTGSGSELYAVSGHAPRQLDLNIALVGRVIDGFDRLTATPRGTEALGFIKDPANHVPISRVTLAADLPAASRPAYQVMRTDSDSYSAYILGRANRGGTFFQRPAGGTDVCNAGVPTRKAV